MHLGKYYLTPLYGNVVLTNNKSFEYQIEPGKKATDMCGRSLFGCSVELTHKRDHAGFTFCFSIAHIIWMSFDIHDNRHWNKLEGRWATPEDYQ